MRILIISPDESLPPDTGGRIRIWNIIKELSATNEVHFVALCSPMPRKQAHEQLKECLASVHLVPHSRRCALLQGLLAVLTGRPYHVGAFRSKALRDVLTSFSRDNVPDLVFVCFVWMTPYLQNFPNTPKVIDQQNTDREWWTSYYQTTHNPLKKLLILLNVFWVTRYEAWAYPQYDLCLSVCTEDKLKTQSLMSSGHPVIVAPNGVDTRLFAPRPGNERALQIAFVGSMDVADNNATIEYFVHAILPLIWKVEPDVRFAIIGRSPGNRIRRLTRDHRIEVTGAVEEIQPYLSTVQVVVVPHRAPGGTKLKVLTSMAMGKAIVATEASARGIDVRNGYHLLIANTPSDFADKVLCLLNDRELRETLGYHARELVVSQYDWRAIVDKMQDELRRLYERNRQSVDREH